MVSGPLSHLWGPSDRRGLALFCSLSRCPLLPSMCWADLEMRHKGGGAQSFRPYPLVIGLSPACCYSFAHLFIRYFNEDSLSVSHGPDTLLGIWVNSEQKKDSCPCGVTVQLGEMDDHHHM